LRCFCCDTIVEEGYDGKTDRFYCFECFEATNDVLLQQLNLEMQALYGTSEDAFVEMNTAVDTKDLDYLEIPIEDERLLDYE
jgi:hypothetical protein